MTDRDLAGCPCCGSSDVFAESYIIEAQVKCRGCGLRVSKRHGRSDERGITKAIAAWNRRAPSSEGDGRDGERLERRALLWLAGGDSGMSSKAICHHMLGMKCDRSYPLDPSDLGRCLRMLELFPEWKARIGEMASYSPQWAGLAARWDELAAMMADEVGIDWSKGREASRTYAAIDAAIAAADRENHG